METWLRLGRKCRRPILFFLLSLESQVLLEWEKKKKKRKEKGGKKTPNKPQDLNLFIIFLPFVSSPPPPLLFSLARELGSREPSCVYYYVFKKEGTEKEDLLGW